MLSIHHKFRVQSVGAMCLTCTGSLQLLNVHGTHGTDKTAGLNIEAESSVRL